MGIRDIFKRKKIKPIEVKKTEATEAKAQQVESGREAEKKMAETKAANVRSSATTKVQGAKIGEAYRILKTPQITEKATDLIKANQYIFKVFAKANKTEIKKAVNELYGVDVLDVKIIKVPAKRRRLGRISGWRKGYKKAIVKIKEGQKIEVLAR